jgi:hypothetical protein
MQDPRSILGLGGSKRFLALFKAHRLVLLTGTLTHRYRITATTVGSQAYRYDYAFEV